MWFVVGGLSAAVLVLGARLAVAERDLVFWKHLAITWRKTAKTYYAQKSAKSWGQVEREFRTWEPPRG